VVDRYGKRDRNFIESEIDEIVIVEQEPKHRYVWLLGDKREKRKMQNKLTYEEKPYPKGKNERYDASGKTSKQMKMFN